MGLLGFGRNFLRKGRYRVPDRCVFESTDTTHEGLSQYDTENNRWRVEFGGNIWKAVDHARSLDHSGEGRRVAIVDSGVDVSIPRLKKLIRKTDLLVPRHVSADKSHGTLVALLISQVAPDVEFEVFDVSTAEGPDEFAVKDALLETRARNTPVINLSLGKPFPLAKITSNASSIDRLAKQELAIEKVPCTLCAAAKEVADLGNVVMASAGNWPGHISCPARQEGVFAVAYKGARKGVISRANDGLGAESTLLSDAKQRQATIWDFSVDEINGLFGTSFATPILSGVAALGLSKEELIGYASSTHPYQYAHVKMSILRTQAMPGDENRRLVNECLLLFEEALRRMPHVHCEFHGKINPRTKISPSEECAFCGFFSEPIYVNYGLFLMETGLLDEGRDFLEAAVRIAPWSPDAAANLAVNHRERGDINSAREWFKKAISLRPGFAVCEEALREL